MTLRNYGGARSSVFGRWWSIVLLVVVLCAPQGAAATAVLSSWVDGNGFWSNPGNWDPAVVPNNATDTYTVVINNGSTVPLDTTVTVDSVFLDFFPPPASKLVLGAGQTLRVNNNLLNGSTISVEAPGTGTFVAGAAVNAGTLLASGGGNLLIVDTPITNSLGTITAK